MLRSWRLYRDVRAVVVLIGLIVFCSVKGFSGLVFQRYERKKVFLSTFDELEIEGEPPAKLRIRRLLQDEYVRQLTDGLQAQPRIP